MSRISNEELRRIVKDATPGPWELRDAESYDGRSTTYYKEVWDDSLNVIASEAYRAYGDGGRGNMRLIALAPQLAAEVLQLREALQGLLHQEIAHVGPFAGQRVMEARAALYTAPVVDAMKRRGV